MKNILLLSFLISLLCGDVFVPRNIGIGQSVVPADTDYFIHSQNNTDIIYSKDNLPSAQKTSKIEKSIHQEYEKLYDWKLDETLSIGLISKHNQIANGFSTQFGNNRQINYMGGTSGVDYFTSKSWLDTLLYHETAHNYQTNVKGSGVSRWLHKIFGNGSIFIPTFTLPNIIENSFMLEGNAVLNESWHGNGGRLYSGRLYAQTLLQAKANKIKPEEVYNTTIEFPYGGRAYIQGGFYNLYMAEKYGLKSINSYFKYHSQDWLLPVFTNKSMRKATGVNFEQSIASFAKKYKELSKSLVMAKGEQIASSQFFYQLNSDENKIFFLTNESGVRAPELMSLSKKDGNIETQRDSYLASKVIKINKEYYTQASKHISTTRITQGLFDSDGFIKEGTESKMIQGYLSDAKEVYFDVPLSFSEPQLFLDGEFYGQVNSSVFIDKDDNLYYFVQTDKKRTLYKNKTPLVSLDAYYGFVNDVDSSGGIYFIANSEYGSSLYKYKNSNITRVSEADNVVEARLINDSKVLIAALGEKDYYYVKTDLVHIKEKPYEVKHFFEEKDYFARIKETEVEELPDASKKYNSFLDMRYSGADFNIASSVNGVVGTLNLKYADPLGQNAVNAFINRNDNKITIAGLGYQSALHQLQYGVYVYGVVEKSSSHAQRNSGVIAFSELPLYQEGYYKATLEASYYQDYNTNSRKPLNIAFSFLKEEHYGKSMYSNYTNSLKVYATKDREDFIYGVKYNVSHDLPAEFYISLEAKYSQTSSDISYSEAYVNARGVKLGISSYSSNLDSSGIGMRSIKANLYLKNAGYIDIGLKKVLNFSSYWFSFPLSLQREAVHVNYKYFALEDFTQNTLNVTELRAGVTASIVFLNSLVFPIMLEYINNDSHLGMDEHQVLFSTGISF